MTPDLTPILAVQDGTYDDSFDESAIDENGNNVQAVATTNSYGTPITDIKTYLNGSLATKWHFNWIAVDGGYVLRYQTLTSYTNGAPVGNVFTEVEWPIEYAQGGSHHTLTTPLRFAANGIKKFVCALGPTEAYAFWSCANEKIGFARDTFLHVTTTVGFVAVFSDPVTGALVAVTPGTAALAIATWTASRHSWTASLVTMLRCIRPARM
jgi:hypothetical protein